MIIAFQPHLFSRTRDFSADFGAALAKADQLFLADIYPAREQPIPGVTSQLIADASTAAGRKPAWTGARSVLAAALAHAVKDGDVVLTVGAGDITRTGPELLALLGADGPTGTFSGASGPPVVVAASNGPRRLVVVASPWWGRAVRRRLDFFRVRRVGIDGARYVSPDEIVSRLRIDTTASLFDDVAPLEKRVRGHPSVRDVRIERKLPGTLLVRITENPPVAFVQAAAGLVAVDAAGRSLPIDPATADVDLPVLAGRDTLELRVLGEVRQHAPALFARIGEVRRLPRGGSFYLLFRLSDTPSNLAHDVLAAGDITAERLSDIIPVEQDLARRKLRATELDLRFRDQVIARLP